MSVKYKDCILTYTKRLFDPFEMTPGDIVIEDIAHSLSMTVRANGHIKHFYSVAQHALDCVREARARGCGTRVQLACLLHDASECYIADIPRPVKHRLAGYAQIEQRISGLVYAACGLGVLSAGEARQLSKIDDALLYHEFLALADFALYKTAPRLTAAHSFAPEDMRDVKEQFLRTYQALRPPGPGA